MDETIKELREALALVILGAQGLIEDDHYNHELVWSEDGDGWNEPYSDDFGCFCEQWDGLGWVQTNPQCTGRIDLPDAALEWVKHIYKDVWKIEENDGDLSQDSDLI